MSNQKAFLTAMGMLLLLVVAAVAQAYPIDAYQDTGIKRLEFYRLAQLGEVRGRRLPPGGLLSTRDIRLNHPVLPVDARGHVLLPEPDLDLSEQLSGLLAEEDLSRYGIAVLDYTNTAAPVYLAHNEDFFSNVGSVGKAIVAVALLQQLADLYPHDTAARQAILRNTIVTADEYSNYDHHKVPLFDVGQRELDYRKLRIGDRGSLWEWLDWMMSASSNAAASMVLQQATLMARFGHQYPAGEESHRSWLVATPHRAEGEVTVGALTHGLEANGLDTARIRQGSYFTRGGKNAAAGVTSYATPRDLVRLLAMMETGTLVDEWSSLELKRLLYMTQRRIRYASHPALNDSAVYFKSGSLYSCKPEPGFTCRKYKGNRKNILASVAVIEHPGDGPRLKYAVAVVSNVLYKNSAVAHQTLAMRIHRMLQREHGLQD